jgi:hypothetical protein
VLILAACGGGSVGATGANGTTGASGATAVLPVALTESQLLNEPAIVHQAMYWIGPKQDYRYEFRRLPNNRIYIRYLPEGVGVDQKSGQLLIVATYPWPHAYASLMKYARGTQVAGTNGSIIVPSGRGDTNGVLMAFPGGNDEIEVYSPNAGLAAKIAKSGQVKPVS